MRGQTHLWIEDPVEIDGTVTVSAIIESPEQERQLLWYRIPVEHRSALTKGADPFVVGTIFMAMRTSTDLVVHGQVSPSLLRNLEEFQAAWTCWQPKWYTHIGIIPDVEKEQPKAGDSTATLVAFSGGVDSCFTTWRHHTGRCGRLKRNIQAGVMVHGFDIPLDEPDVFQRAAEKSARILGSLGIPLIPIATNFRDLKLSWVDVFAAGAASCFMMLQGGYTAALFGAGERYSALILPWGSNPITDGLLSSDTFQFIHDGAAFSRVEKVREIADWTEALPYLRVCWEGEQKDRNCGRCEKCVRTILDFRVVGVDLPGCFEQDVTEDQIINMRDLTPIQIIQYKQILSTAQAASLTDSWVVALEKLIKRNEARYKPRTGFGYRIRRALALRKRVPWLVEAIESKIAGDNR